jgi:site-specific DNA-methyltransferase (adenine-specific)
MTDKLTLHHGDCLEVLRSLPDCSVDSVVTDPPYGLSFMGKRWDYDVPSVEVWAECLRVLKPGGHLLAFAGTRTQHRMAVRIEDAGFEIRDMIAWVYGSGFPKSLDVSKAIDKAAGAEREVVGNNPTFRKMQENASNYNLQRNEFITAPATPEAKQWQGWGTALKPALEPITVARKPLIGTVAENVLQHGTGAINVDGGRVGTEDKIDFERKENGITQSGWKDVNRNPYEQHSEGRWPANFIHDGSEEVMGLFPQAGGGFGKRGGRNGATVGDYGMGATMETVGYGDSGSAARFFYCAKASKADRDEGCEKLQERSAGECVDRVEGSAGMESPRAGAGRTSGSRNHHPTVKPTDLMRYLCRLVTPPNGIVLDPFMGSGSTGKAAMLEGFAFVGIEREAEYIDIAKARIQSAVGLL